MVAVRYYSKSGNTKLLAEAIAKGAGVIPISVDEDSAKITENIDVLFIGGALYAYGLDKELNNYLAGIDGKKVKKAVVFSTSWLSKACNKESYSLFVISIYEFNSSSILSWTNSR